MEAATASVCGSEATASASGHHRAWYEQNNPSVSTAANTSAVATSSDQLDAYFKGSNATTAAYFSQMQAGAYPGMSYHGNFLSNFYQISQEILPSSPHEITSCV